MPVVMHGLCPLLQVYDMPTSVRFYRDVLGFEVFNSSAPRSPDDCDWVWLKQGETELMLNSAYEHDSRPQSRDPARAAAHADVGLFIGCPTVDEAYRYLLDKGLDVKPPKLQPYGMKPALFEGSRWLCYLFPVEGLSLSGGIIFSASCYPEARSAVQAGGVHHPPAQVDRRYP